MFRIFRDVSLVRMMKSMIKGLKNAFRFVNLTKFTTSNKANATHSNNSTAANATRDTTQHSKNAKTYAITDFNGFPQIRNAVHPLFQNSKTSANTMKD